MKSENGSASGAGNQTKYKGSSPYSEPMKNGPPMNVDFHTKSARIFPDMKGPGMETPIDAYPKLDAQEAAENDTPPKALHDFWTGEAKDKSNIGDLGSTEGPMFNGKMPANINIKRDI